MANNCLNKPKNDFNQRQRQISSESGAQGLESARGLEPTAKPDVQEVDVGR